jgi:hypothetical protein
MPPTQDEFQLECKRRWDVSYVAMLDHMYQIMVETGYIDEVRVVR